MSLSLSADCLCQSVSVSLSLFLYHSDSRLAEKQQQEGVVFCCSDQQNKNYARTKKDGRAETAELSFLAL